ncbi:PREDICTED: leucine-rich repeat-containing protein 15 [Nicrophorus vespilloides]|uniref:Leucine-rich repeat-containing protein 15 n=1 Tax=Nicrophorus vespilloides TaxID=110193 RepID=A0ABM1MHW8_NICVS|nr:PREDICTED: leucine-rich repeat-containing protein 15 [Nicrophorus vespilloides]
MMKVLAVFALILCAVQSVPTKRAAQELCPAPCVCTENDEATCNTLDLSPFGKHIDKLKIVSPKKPLKLTAEIFKRIGLESLKQLFIEDATIEKIDPNAFAGIAVSNLFIKNSKIPELPINVFIPMTDLTVIDFTNSTFTNFEDIQSATVKEIKLSGCNLREIKSMMFSKCPQLNYLNLENNNIEHFNHPYIFPIEELNLAGNKISHFNFKSLVNMNESLATLVLSGNPIVKFENAAQFENDIEKIELKSCGLKNIDFVKHFSALTELDLSDNKISVLDENIFSALSEFEILDLSGNLLQSLPDTIFKDNIRLRKLTLDRNNLKTLPKFKTNDVVMKLEHFSCDGCGLTKLDKQTFEYLPSLQTINLQNNKLTDLPETIFQYVPSLVKIYLSNNDLTTLNESLFLGNSRLTTVVLSGNPLKVLNIRMFKNNKFLQHLDVSSCDLFDLWEGEGNKISLPHLTVVNAKNNRINTITIDQISHMENLASLELAGNPIYCNGVTLDTIRYLKTKLSYESENLESWVNKCSDEDDDDDSIQEDDYSYDEKSMLYVPELSKTDQQKLVLDDDIELDSDRLPFREIFNEDEGDDDDDENEDEDDDEEQQFLDDVESVMSVDVTHFTKQRNRIDIFMYLKPTIVFVLTTLFVLLITVSVILLLLQGRNNRNANVPKINIIPWSNQKVKKHSGSVYRPLSEEKLPEIN